MPLIIANSRQSPTVLMLSPTNASYNTTVTPVLSDPINTVYWEISQSFNFVFYKIYTNNLYGSHLIFDLFVKI